MRRSLKSSVPGCHLLFFLLILGFLAENTVGELADNLVIPAPARADEESVRWYDIRALDVEGRGWNDTAAFYDRLPARAESVVREPVWDLSRHSAGMCVRFTTDASRIKARWTLTQERLGMPHMNPASVSGLDLYMQMEDRSWRWVSATKPNEFPVNTAILADGLSPAKRTFLLYLPLYNGVSKVELGLDDEARLWKADPWRKKREKPILFYGTSITHGASSSRPGMCHPSILQRWFNMPLINLGFSGNGRMEPEMAEFISELEPAVFVLDCLPNMEWETVRERTEPFIKKLREKHPGTPILMVEDREYSNAFLDPEKRTRNIRSQAEYRKAYQSLLDQGCRDLYYLEGNLLLGHDNEGTVDSSHPTDLGFMRQAQAIYDILRPVLLPEEEAALLPEEWKRSDPDFTVFLPTGYHDGDNEHFLVFEAPKSDELLALWTQSSVEGRGDNRIVLARSFNQERWSDPVTLAGCPAGEQGKQASWGFPITADNGRIYVFYTREIDKYDIRQGSGFIGIIYSDDNGYEWAEGPDIPFRKDERYDNPDPAVPPNWIVWQKPVRDSQGRWIAGYTRTSSNKNIPQPNKNWVDRDSRSAFIRFDNIAEGPDPADLQLTWLPQDGASLEVPHKVYPEISVAQEPALVLLPDGRLFTIIRTMTGYVYYSVSENAGVSWRKPEPLRYRDGGKPVEHPMAPAPIYALEDGRFIVLFNNNPGIRGEYDQFRKNWSENQSNHLRNPSFISVGEFRPGAHQPLWFSIPKIFADTDGMAFGPKGTASIAMYPSLTEKDGVRVIWYPDRKHFLLGKKVTDEWLKDMVVPENSDPGY